MNPRTRVHLVIGIIVGLLGVVIARGFTSTRADVPPEPFYDNVSLEPFEDVAVFHRGRLKPFPSFAAEAVGFVSGMGKVRGHTDGFTYLDMMFRPETYAQSDVVYVPKKPFRGQIANRIRERMPAVVANDSFFINRPELDAAGREAWINERLDRFVKRGRIAAELLNEEGVRALLGVLSRDVIKTAKHVERVQAALATKDPQNLALRFAIVPPPGGDDKTPWISPEALFRGGSEAVIQRSPESAMAITSVRNDWQTLTRAWRAQDVQVVNETIVSLAATLPTLNPEVYPDRDRLALESWYTSSGGMTWVWLFYLAAVAVLLGAVAYQWASARWVGMGLFALALALHTTKIGLRWYVSGRWPNSNMFEAVTTAAWFGCIVALLLEYWGRKTPLKNVFALTAAVASMFALMTANFSPKLDSSINNMMPILHDAWLYIHTNVIIASYALIAMASVTGLIYLLYRLGGGKRDYARLGGAAALIETTGGTLADARHKPTLGEVMDGATMILMELAVIMLWAGIIMGAVWADHSWGRPWGWDPKEVFALNTLIIFLVLVHIRLKVVDKGLWTAWLAVIGCGVMLFNWIIINFVISGLHSYA
ncbi:MAG: cytochrome c biogenesis protein CcsA [Planctomycetota bacterium]